jgi:hypothetical protein
MELSEIHYTAKLKEEIPDTTYYPLFDCLDNLNLDHLRRKRFGNMECNLRLKKEYARKGVLREFYDLPIVNAVRI